MKIVCFTTTSRTVTSPNQVKQFFSGHLAKRLPFTVYNSVSQFFLGLLKLNNILFDKKSGKPICVVDLDTIMPGACAYDFGDSIRFGASSALEDEKDLDKVYMKLDLFEAYTEGYMKAVGKTLTPAEAKSLAVGAMLLTYETGIRFLGDYLNGDVYFKTHRPGQNLDRARTQLKLVADMESKFDQMQAIVEKYYKLANQ